MSKVIVKVGTRGSRLALAQAEYVIARLQEKFPGTEFIPVPIETTGDLKADSPLEGIGGTGLFTKRIELALLKREIDLAVHSAKDLPSIMTNGLMVGAVPRRESNADAWISGDGSAMLDIAPRSRIGTGSPRRRAQLLHARPDLMVLDIRGNIETRLAKLKKGQYDAVILAYAGLLRSGYDDEITEILPVDKFLPAPGQGALAIQIRLKDEKMARISAAINDPDSYRCLKIERMLMRRMNAGCSTAIGGFAYSDDESIRLSAVILDNDGKRRLYAESRIDAGGSDDMLVNDTVEQLLSAGASEIINGCGK
jgi:hydroxymethylbilane synthase